MRRYLTILTLFLLGLSMGMVLILALPAQSQVLVDKEKTLVDATLDTVETRTHMEFLASDAMKGRDTGTPGLKKAAEYLVQQMKKYGVNSVPGAHEGYYQPVPLQKKKSVQEIILEVNGRAINEKQIAVLSGSNRSLDGKALWRTNTNSDLQSANVSDRVLVVGTNRGKSGSVDLRRWMEDSKAYHRQADSLGAKAVVHLFRSDDPQQWAAISSRVSNPGFSLSEDLKMKSKQQSIPNIILHDADGSLAETIAGDRTTKISVDIKGGKSEYFYSNNVIGMVEGTSAKLKDEFVLLTAHYDHIGLEGGATAGQDSINNGARDNGIGMVALLQAAKNIAAHPVDRSVLFLFITAEEKGLLGSKWYAEHPLIDLKKTIFNLNIDGAGYNDTSKVVVVGLNKTSARNHFVDATDAYHLDVTASPVPQLKLFYRSDNIMFARKGIPAPTFTQGFTSFDAELQKYYHQPADEVETLNYHYLNTYYSSFNLALRLIANDPMRPKWLEGEEFIKAYESLYKR